MQFLFGKAIEAITITGYDGNEGFNAADWREGRRADDELGTYPESHYDPQESTPAIENWILRH